MYNGIPFVPRDGHTLRVIHLGRISTDHQNIENIDAARDATVETVLDDYAGEMRLTSLGDAGSGWTIQRDGVQTAMQMIRDNQVDVVLMEDVGRAFRNPQFQYRFAHLCVDHRVRYIAPGDHFDTAVENWESSLALSVTRHALFVPDTRRRVKRTATFAFRHGGMVLHLPFGYRRVSADAATTGANGRVLRMAKNPDATPAIRGMVERILAGETLEGVARWLNDTDVPVGPKVEGGRWCGKNVSDLLRNPLLHGERMFRRMCSQIIYETGEYRREPNATPMVDHCPELAHLTVEEHQQVLAELERRNPKRGPSGREGMARSDTTFPHQHLRCGICGSIMYRMSDRHLMCKQSRLIGGVRRCWNRTRVDLNLCRTQFMSQLAALVRETPDLQTRLVDAALAQYQLRRRGRDQQVSQIGSVVRDLERRQSNLLDLVEAGRQSEGLAGRLCQLELELAAQRQRLDTVSAESTDEMPTLTREQIVDRLEEVFLQLSTSSCEFAAVLRRELPELIAHPMVNVISGRIIPRITCPLRSQTTGCPAQLIEFHGTTPSLGDRLVEQFLNRADGEPEFEEFGIAAGYSRHWRYRARRRLQELNAAGHTELYRQLETQPECVPRWKRDSTNGGDERSPLAADEPAADAES